MLSLEYTGHPFFDVGLATVVAYAGKTCPADLKEDDLYKVADFIETYYTQQPLTSFLTVSLMNSDFTQPAFKDKSERRREYARLVARSFGPDVPQSEEICVFTGEPALGRSLSLKKDKEGGEELPPGKAYRQHIPLITGENVINFSPWGDPGVPVSGIALLCLQFFPMGCLKCGGRLLAIHSDNPDILLAAAREALHKNEQGISLARVKGETKLPDASSSAQTLIIETLLNMDLNRLDALDAKQPYSVTAYHLTNSGQSSSLDERNPLLKIYHLPMNIIRFIRAAYHPDYKDAWNALVVRGWERPKPPKNRRADQPKGREEEVSISSRRGRNYFYEDIFRLPEYAREFVRIYLMRMPKHNAKKEDPRSDYNLRREINLISWKFTELFLHEVMHMDKERIEAIRNLGDTLASYVKEQGDKRFFRNFYEVTSANDFMTVLLKANRNYTAHGHAPLFGLDSFCRVFLEQEGETDTLKFDWRFARDLVFIRMIEWLHENNNWLRENLDALPEDQDTPSNTNQQR
jgi:CRISPR-associated protein Cst1